MVIEKVHSLRRGQKGGGGSLRSKQKRTGGGGGPSMSVRSLFLKKKGDFKMKFYSYSPVFPIDYNRRMKY